MRKLLSLLAITCLCTISLVGCGSADSKNNAPQKEAQNKVTPVSSEIPMVTGKHHVEIDVKDYGTIKLELDADVAPISTSNFLDLAKSKFYDGLTFHRIISGFMIQGGDPVADGTGGSGRLIKGEFSNNGVENSISHVRGTISMARSTAYDSASSQFFICHQDATSLDGEYAAFGKVTSGMEVVDKIATEVSSQAGSGSVKKDNQPVITTIKVID